MRYAGKRMQPHRLVLKKRKFQMPTAVSSTSTVLGRSQGLPLLRCSCAEITSSLILTINSALSGSEAITA
uniref:Uncharacterized protein n=1 Tax=Arundo donax TaxID=35708 RepID=A0A0A9UC14_ARUDO